MGWPIYIAIFLTIWWVVIFAVLPFGVRSQAEEGEIAEGSDPGAPARPLLLAKAIWTTVLSMVIFAMFYYWIEYM